MAYQSLYRKYRPQTFADVVGQGHVTRTIQNALESGRVAHGYLFTGTRGTAKTTVARLLAKALNCESTDHPMREPCNKCSACVAITAGAAIDVIEMDAASHRGVADIEEVRKAVGFGPMELRYKVFIIDEAHQLSSDAKDAFLKTLEEPPPNVVFILATTEPQAIPITIRSRCQQFDFKRGSLGDITERLRYVLDCEGVGYAKDALGHIARGAEGSYRDSLSLLEQVLAFSPTKITTADVDTVLGTLDTEMLRRVTAAIAGRDAPTIFTLAGELLDAGKEARTLLRTLSLHFRDLLLVSVGGPAVGQELTPEEVAPLQLEARAFQPPEMIRAMEILNEAQGETRWNNQHRLLVELTFLKLMNLGTTAGATNSVAAFVTAPITFPAARPPAAQPPARAAEMPLVVPRETSPVVAAAVASPPMPPPRVVAASEPPTVAADEPVVATLLVAETPDLLQPESLPTGYFADDRRDDEDDDEIEPIDTLTGNLFVDEPAVGIAEGAEESAEAPFTPVAEGSAVAPSREAEIAAAPAVALVPPAVPEEATPAVAEPEVEPAGFTLDDVLHVWPDFLRKSGTVSKMTETMMLQAYPSGIQNGIVEVTFKSESAYDKMNQPKGQEFVRKLLRHCLRMDKVGIRFVLNESGGGSSGGGGGHAAPPPTRSAPREKRRERDPIAEIDTLDAADGRSRAVEGYGGGGSYGEPPDYGGYPPAATAASSVSRAPITPPKSPIVAPTASRVTAPSASAGAPTLVTSAIPHSEASSAPSALNGNGVGGAKPHLSAQSALDDPLVQEVLSTFGGEIVND